MTTPLRFLPLVVALAALALPGAAARQPHGTARSVTERPQDPPGGNGSALPLPPAGAFEEEARRREHEDLEHALADAEQHVDEWGPKSPLGRNLMLGMILFGALLALVLGVFFRRKAK